MIKYGLKLRSTNNDIFDKAINSIGSGFFDFIELYIVPGEINFDSLKILEPYEINIHTTQSIHGFNPIDPNSKAEETRDSLISKYIKYFDPKTIVMHPEHGDDINILKKRLDYFNDKRILIENMPKYGIESYSIPLFGYTLEQLKQIKKLGYDICLDFEKAIKSAGAQRIDYKQFIGDIIKEFNPTYFHISGCNVEKIEDQHTNLREANFDIKWIKNKLIEISNKKDIFLVFETPKTGNIIDIDNDLKNLIYFKKL